MKELIKKVSGFQDQNETTKYDADLLIEDKQKLQSETENIKKELSNLECKLNETTTNCEKELTTLLQEEKILDEKLLPYKDKISEMRTGSVKKLEKRLKLNDGWYNEMDVRLVVKQERDRHKHKPLQIQESQLRNSKDLKHKEIRF